MVQTRQQIIENFKSQIENGKLSHAYLFLDSNDSNYDLVLKLIGVVLGIEDPKTYFNFVEVSMPEDKKNISVDQLRELQNNFQTVSQEPKLALINGAQHLSEAASNSILKFIEEPSINQYIFLLANSQNQILPTIISRTQVIKLPDAAYKSVFDIAKQNNMSDEDANLLAKTYPSESQAQNAIESLQFDSLKNVINDWITLITNKDYQAFIFVEAQIMPLIGDKDTFHTFIKLLINILEEDVTGNVGLLSAVLEESSKEAQNVAPQNILEMIALGGLEA